MRGFRHRHRRGGGRRAPGHTMIELLLGLVVMTILMGAMVVTMAIAARAIDDGTGPTARALDAAALLEEVNADLSLALRFTERTAQAVTFVVPDRNGDGANETIRYAWSGEPACRLTRQVNGGPAVVLAEEVRHFGLAYGLKTVTPSPQ